MTVPEETVVSGLRVRLLPVPGAHTVGACLRVSAGSSADPPFPWGTAHLTEHLRIAAALDGGSRSHLTGHTGNAETRFTVAAVPEHGDRVVRTLVRLLDPARSGAAALEAERHAVALEMRAGAVNPLVLLGPAAAEAAVPEGRAADTARADGESLDRITLDDVARFTAEHYRPENAVLVLAAPSLDRERVLDVIASALPSPRAPVEPGNGDAERIPLVLPSDVDGLTVLTLPSAVSELVGRSAVRALTSPSGPLATRTARAGFPLVGSTVIAAEEHEVTVLCWRDERSDRRLRDALTSALAAEDEGVAAWHGADRREYQERAFAGVSPLGRAQLALVPPSPVPAARTMPGELRRAAASARLWRARAGVLHAEDLPEEHRDQQF